ncbi:hypothetical protein [Mandarin fish ranavirus]|uniref:Ig-like domain-containing protein n=1 Tax=Largemouth bass virus TaxID=176656 RepID=A0A9E7THZ2_9VIRU|nr:hypothetical protein [Largemouth bass virus]WAK75067.1 hypothetical protein [Mandarin fish ranavirus]WHA35492.1 hypothetical protein MSRaV_4R [Micropterus salmoides ranavirus]WHA35597.1 hypothetical protein SCRaV_4R [Siniperca chuatsi ranavirus]
MISTVVVVATLLLPLGSFGSTQNSQVTVGGQVTMPCNWSAKVTNAGSDPAVVWKITASGGTDIYSKKGTNVIYDDDGDYTNRTFSPLDASTKNCSLVLSDARFLDAQTYQAYILHPGVRDTTTQTFIISYKLKVNGLDQITLNCSTGSDLTIDLVSSTAKTVKFSGSPFWERNQTVTNNRLSYNASANSLTLRNLSTSDVGHYVVSDTRENTIVTVVVSVYKGPTRKPLESFAHCSGRINYWMLAALAAALYA